MQRKKITANLLTTLFVETAHAVGTSNKQTRRYQTAMTTASRVVFALFWVPSALAEQFAVNSLCVNETDTRGSKPIQYFPSYSAPCPEIGSFLKSSFQFRYPKHTSGASNAATQVSVAVSHDGGVDGISMALSRPSFCDTAVANADYSRAETNYLLCEGRLKSPSQLCSATSYNGEPGEISSVLVLVRNDGTCLGNLTIGVGLRDISSDITVWSSCVSPIELFSCDNGNEEKSGGMRRQLVEAFVALAGILMVCFSV